MDINKLLNAQRVTINYLDVDVDGSDVKSFRKKNDLTQVALANIFGVTKKTIEKWEQGVNKIGGSSAVLLTLLNKYPEILKKIYSVQQVDSTYTNSKIITFSSIFEFPKEESEKIISFDLEKYGKSSEQLIFSI